MKYTILTMWEISTNMYFKLDVLVVATTLTGVRHLCLFYFATYINQYFKLQ